MRRTERGSRSGGGLGEWIIQRVSAVYVLLFTVWLGVSLSVSPVHSHADWVSFSSGYFFRAAAILFIVSLLMHAWTGLKSVFLDYVHNWRLRFVLLMTLALLFTGMLAWAIIVIGGV